MLYLDKRKNPCNSYFFDIFCLNGCFANEDCLSPNKPGICLYGYNVSKQDLFPKKKYFFFNRFQFRLFDMREHYCHWNITQRSWEAEKKEGEKVRS